MSSIAFKNTILTTLFIVVATPLFAADATGGIAWYPTLDAGFKEAKRSGRPILFLSAAPHCGGVSGVW